LKEVVSDIAESANITGGLKVDTITTTGNVDITGDLVVNDVNVIDNITTLQQNNVIYNSDEYGLKAVSNWVAQTGESGNWNRVVYAPELNLFVAINKTFSGNRIMTSPNGIDWEYANNSPANTLFDIVWSPELSLFVVVYTQGSYVATSPDGKNWTERSSPVGNLIAVSWSPELSLFATISFNGKTTSSTDGITWTERQSINTAQGQDICWSSELGLFVAVAQTGTNRVAYSKRRIKLGRK